MAIDGRWLTRRSDDKIAELVTNSIPVEVDQGSAVSIRHQWIRARSAAGGAAGAGHSRTGPGLAPLALLNLECTVIVVSVVSCRLVPVRDAIRWPAHVRRHQLRSQRQRDENIW